MGLDPSILWFDVDEAYEGFLDDSLDAAVVTLLIPAMAKGLDLRVEGPMSALLAWSLGDTVIPVTRELLPFLGTTTVEPTEFRYGYPNPGKAITSGLSRGIDSFSVCYEQFLNPDLPDALRLTHLLFMHLGHHGYGSDLEGRVAARWEGARAAAAELGLPLIRINSNAPEFYPSEHNSRLNWAATITVRAAAGPLLLQRGIRRFIMGASGVWNRMGVRPIGWMTVADPVLLPALSTENVALAPTGTDLTRIEKTRRIAGQELVRRHLDVCIMEAGLNCSRCEKCLRTLLTLELLGYLDDYAERFDLDTYRRRRDTFLARILADRTFPMYLELQELIVESGFRVPLKSRALKYLLRLWRLVPHPLRKRIRGL